jgi:hypothetical protein
MSLTQAVVRMFGVTYGDGDPDERSGADLTSRDDRSGERSAPDRSSWRVDGAGPPSDVSAASGVCG